MQYMISGVNRTEVAEKVMVIFFLLSLFYNSFGLDIITLLIISFFGYYNTFSWWKNKPDS